MYGRCIERGEVYCGFSSYTTNVMNSSEELTFLKGYNSNSIDSKMSQENTKEYEAQVRTPNDFLMAENENDNDNGADDNFLHHSDFGGNDDVLLFNFTPESPNVSTDETVLIINKEDAEENIGGNREGSGSGFVDDSDSKNNDISNKNKKE